MTISGTIAHMDTLFGSAVVTAHHGESSLALDGAAVLHAVPPARYVLHAGHRYSHAQLIDGVVPASVYFSESAAESALGLFVANRVAVPRGLLRPSVAPSVTRSRLRLAESAVIMSMRSRRASDERDARAWLSLLRAIAAPPASRQANPGDSEPMTTLHLSGWERRVLERIARDAVPSVRLPRGRQKTAR